METYVKGPVNQEIGYPEVAKNPDVEIYEGGWGWGPLFMGLLVIILFVGAGLLIGKSYLDDKIQIVKLQSEIKYNCLTKTP